MGLINGHNENTTWIAKNKMMKTWNKCVIKYNRHVKYLSMSKVRTKMGDYSCPSLHIAENQG